MVQLPFVRFFHACEELMADDVSIINEVEEQLLHLYLEALHTKFTPPAPTSR